MERTKKETEFIGKAYELLGSLSYILSDECTLKPKDKLELVSNAYQRLSDVSKDLYN